MPRPTLPFHVARFLALVHRVFGCRAPVHRAPVHRVARETVSGVHGSIAMSQATKHAPRSIKQLGKLAVHSTAVHSVAIAMLVGSLLYCDVDAFCSFQSYSESSNTPSTSSESHTKPSVATKQVAHRMPIAIEYLGELATEDESKLVRQNGLAILNRRSGTLSIITKSTKRWEVSDEVQVGEQPSSIASVRGSDGKVEELWITDEARHTVTRWRQVKQAWTPLQELEVSRYPVSVAISEDGERAVVASLWSHRLTLLKQNRSTSVQLEPSESNRTQQATSLSTDWQITETVDLPFAPRKLVSCGSSFVVADAFGGQMAAGHFDQPQALRFFEVPGHNVRGLAVSDDGSKLAVAHQTLNEFFHSTQGDIHWGFVLSNDLLLLSLENLGDRSADALASSHVIALGKATAGTGDPSEVTITGTGKFVVALSGVDEVAIGVENELEPRRVSVGDRPVAVATDVAGRLAFVANAWDDSISVIDLEDNQVTETIRLGPRREVLSKVEMGEQLFYDASLSHDRWMSCHSCHTDGHSNGGLNDNLSDNAFGSPKRVLSLLGSSKTLPWTWQGNIDEPLSQVHNSIAKTMQSDRPVSNQDAEAIVAFLQTLDPPPGVDVARGSIDRDAVTKGTELFQIFGCVECHQPPTYTTPLTYDVGLVDAHGNREFNPPSLLGVSQRSQLFHDNRAKSLREVFADHEHQLPRELDQDELDCLLSFLRTL